MPVGIQGEKLFGAVGHPQNTAVLMDTIYKLKQELQKSDAEKHALAEQLNCLVLLVKRSWSGDHNASLHLGNIVGVAPPGYGPDDERQMTNNTPIPEKTRAVRNWERMAIGLLDIDYARVQEEIRDRQQLYIERRQLYMEEILQSHQKEMSKVPMSRAKHKKSLEEVDKKFMRTFQKRPPAGGRPMSAVNPRQYRVQSAANRQRSNSDAVNLTLGDIINPNQTHTEQDPNYGYSGIYKMDADTKTSARYQNRVDYDDPSRYKPAGNLFDFESAFGQENESNAKKRPISAFMPRDKDRQRVRPQSAGVFLTQNKDRPLKYETTRPVSGKPSSKTTGQRKKIGTLRSTSAPSIKLAPQEEEQNFNENHPINANEHDQFYNDISDEEIEKSTPMKVSFGPYPKRPQHVDQFVKDLKNMEQMEQDFRDATVQLQKKLGIGSDGIIY